MSAKIPPLPAAARKPTALRGFALAAGIPLFIICAFYVVRELDLDGITLTATVVLIFGAVLFITMPLIRRGSLPRSAKKFGRHPHESGDLLDDKLKLFDDSELQTNLLFEDRVDNIWH
jgi:hypothetical protein